MPWLRNCWPWILKNPELVISRLYRDQDTIAVLLWKALRKQFPAEDRPAALKHLRRLLTGKPDATAVEELRRLAARIEPQLEARGLRRLARRRNFRPPGPQAAGPGDALSSLWPGQADHEISCPHRHGGRLRADFDRRRAICMRKRSSGTRPPSRTKRPGPRTAAARRPCICWAGHKPSAARRPRAASGWNWP